MIDNTFTFVLNLVLASTATIAGILCFMNKGPILLTEYLTKSKEEREADKRYYYRKMGNFYVLVSHTLWFMLYYQVSKHPIWLYIVYILTFIILFRGFRDLYYVQKYGSSKPEDRKKK